eukprot:UN07546
MKDVATIGPLAINAGRNTTPTQRRTVLRNLSIQTQLQNVPAEKFSELSPTLRYEAGMWLAYYTRIRYAEVMSRGFKKSELIRDNELILKYLTFTPEELQTFPKTQLVELYKAILEVSQVVDSIEHLSTAYQWLFDNCKLPESDEPSPTEQQLAALRAASKSGDHSLEEDVKALYLSLPIEDT